MNTKSIGVLIPTWNAESTIEKLLEKIDTERYDVLVVDSSSRDATRDLVKKYNIRLITIPQKDFNHGSTREYGRKLLNTDIIVMLTQDIEPEDRTFIEKLVSPIVTGVAQVAYARQLPRDGANIFESFPRIYNYPGTSHVRSINDLPQYGIYTFFCSDSCSAYLNSVLDEIGGFEHTLTWEDYFATAKILQNGHRIAYVAESRVKHSHKYTLIQEFQRYFDAGYVRVQNRYFNLLVGQAEQRGMDYTARLIREVIRCNILLLPFAIFQSAIKWVGYRIGYFSTNVPVSVKKRLSSQKYYWDSISSI